MKSKKIIIVHVHVTPVFAGAVKFSFDILSNLDADKYELYILYSDLVYVKPELKAEFISRFQANGIKTIGLKYLSRKISFRDVFGTLELYSVLKNLSPQIVNSVSSKPWILCSILSVLLRKPFFIHTIQGLSWNLEDFWPKRKLYHLLEWISSLSNDRLVFVNQLYMKYFEMHRFKSLYIPNCMDFKKNSFSIYDPKNNINLLFIGRIDPQKDILTLLKAFQIVKSRLKSPKLYLDIVGDDIIGGGSEIIKAKKFIEEHPDLINFITFHGWQSDITPYLEKADIFVSTSIYEGFGIVFLEAGNFNLPVISTDVDGIPEVVIHNFGGLLSKKYDFLQIAADIEKLVLDNNLRLQMGDWHGKHVRDNFSKDNIVAQYDNLYTSLIYPSNKITHLY